VAFSGSKMVQQRRNSFYKCVLDMTFHNNMILVISGGQSYNDFVTPLRNLPLFKEIIKVKLNLKKE
jgi:hypothetical protein